MGAEFITYAYELVNGFYSYILLIQLARHCVSVVSSGKDTPQVEKSNLQNLHLFPFLKEGAHPKREKSFVSFGNYNKDIIRLSDIITTLEGVF